MPDWSSFKKLPDLFWVALIAVVMHAVFLTLLPASLRANESDDFKYFYSPVAKNLLEGRGYVNTDGEPGTVYPPGFPVILAGVYDCGRLVGLPDSFSLRLFAALMTVGSTLLIFFLARQSFGRKTAWLAALLWIFYPGQLWTGKQPNSELPFLLLAGLGLWTLLKRKEFLTVFPATLFLLTIYFWGMTVVVLSIIRYMIPVMGLLMIPAAVGIEYLFRWGGKNHHPRQKESLDPLKRDHEGSFEFQQERFV